VHFEGEHLAVDERLVVSPGAGIFHPVEHLPRAVLPGTTVGFLRTGRNQIDIVCPFEGELVALVVEAGERLTAHQRVAWLRAA
jgi:hypothetical protein